jgi:hypothetical protein
MEHLGITVYVYRIQVQYKHVETELKK